MLNHSLACVRQATATAFAFLTRRVCATRVVVFTQLVLWRLRNSCTGLRDGVPQPVCRPTAAGRRNVLGPRTLRGVTPAASRQLIGTPAAPGPGGLYALAIAQSPLRGCNEVAPHA